MGVKQIEVFNIKDNDIVIVRIDHPLTSEDRGKIEATWTDIFKEQGFKNIKVIVLNGVTLEVLSRG